MRYRERGIEIEREKRGIGEKRKRERAREREQKGQTTQKHSARHGEGEKSGCETWHTNYQNMSENHKIWRRGIGGQARGRIVMEQGGWKGGVEEGVGVGKR